MTARHALIAALFSCFALSAQASNGTIAFLGYITEATCLVSLQHKTVNANCPRTTQTTQFSIHPATKNQKLPLHQGAMDIKWLNDSHKKGIITTTYR
jgi:type 1 fimbria pilin